MGKRSRRSFDRFFILMIMISVGGWLVWEYVIPSIRGSNKPSVPQTITAEPAVPPPIDLQAIGHAIVTFLLWALCALVVVGLIWGLWKYRGKLFRSGNFSRWWETIIGTPEDRDGQPFIPKWTWHPEDMKDPLAFKVWDATLNFKPKRSYNNERGYHEELYARLKKDFRQAKFEEVKGGVRVDIGIDNIAVEIKAPTRKRELDTIGHKTIVYSNYYGNVIFVLFRPDFAERHFREIKVGMQSKCPYAGVITKKG